MSGGGHDAPASHKPGHGGHDEEHEEHVNHEAWVIPYADMLTLLMALFLMLWATSSADEKKFAALADSLREAFGQGTGELAPTVGIGSPGFMDGQQSGVENGDRDVMPERPDVNEILPVEPSKASAENQKAAHEALDREKSRAEAEAREAAALDGVQQRVTEMARAEGVLDALRFRRESRGLVVTVVTDHILFDSGSAVLKPEGERVLRVVAEALRGVSNEVMVEGHTDNTPIATDRYPTNWELSSHRGTSVLRYIVDATGFNPNRIGSAGYGETRPITSNDSPEGRSANRRVEVVVLSAL